MSVFAPNKVALITGGASGIGLALSKLCRSHGMRTAIVDTNPAALAQAKEVLAAGEDVMTHETDVSKPEQWAALKDAVLAKFGGVDLLVLNAGIGMRGTWGDEAYFEKTLNTNLFGVIHGLNTFVPLFKEKNTPLSIVVTGSKQGITNPPGNPAYNASKAAVKSLTEQLSYEFRGSSTSVHLLVPGWTFTGMTGGGPSATAEKPSGAWLPEQVADYLYEKMKEDKFYVICPDNEVTEEMDRKRIAWAAGDITEGRKPLSRWREDYKEEVAKNL